FGAGRSPSQSTWPEIEPNSSPAAGTGSEGCVFRTLAARRSEKVIMLSGGEGSVFLVADRAVQVEEPAQDGLDLPRAGRGKELLPLLLIGREVGGHGRARIDPRGIGEPFAHPVGAQALARVIQVGCPGERRALGR